MQPLAGNESRGTGRFDRNVVEKDPLFFNLSLTGVCAGEDHQAVDNAAEPARFGLDPTQRRDVVLSISRLL